MKKPRHKVWPVPGPGRLRRDSDDDEQRYRRKEAGWQKSFILHYFFFFSKNYMIIFRDCCCCSRPVIAGFLVGSLICVAGIVPAITVFLTKPGRYLSI